jgi:hypothetical protein
MLHLYKYNVTKNLKVFLFFIDYIQSALHVQYTLIKNLKIKHSVL